MRLHLAASVLCLALAATGQTQTEPMRCADLSALDDLEAAGAVYRDGAPGDALRILRDHGLDTIRLRVWHTPAEGRDGLDDALALAARADALGMRLLLNLHYSDTWADPGRQTPPAAWAGLTGALLRDSVRTYTRRVVRAFVDQGTPPAFVQIGNEITGGMLWDEGRVGGAFDTDAQWSQLAALVQAGINGAREAAPKTSIVVHIDRGGDSGGVRWFLDHLLAEGVVPDVLGLSFYPWWHGTLADFRATLDLVADRYDLPVFVAETAYPWTLGYADDTTNLVGLPEQVLPGFPATPEGQAAFVSAVTEAVADTPNGLGVCYWAPEDVAAPGRGSAWESVALFDFEGNVLPAASVLGRRATSRDATPESSALAIWPNPATISATVRFTASERACHRVVVHDALGRVVADVMASCGLGPQAVTIATERLPAGWYRVVVSTPDGRLSQGSFTVVR